MLIRVAPPKPLQTTPRPLAEIKRLIEMYEPECRRWCDAPERGGCACMGCVRWPAFSTLRPARDPEGTPFPNPADQLMREEVEIYLAAYPQPKREIKSVDFDGSDHSGSEDK